MKKRLIAILSLVLLLMSGCGGTKDKEEQCVLIFMQKGEIDIVRTVEYGGTLYDVPTPKEKEGYDVCWEKTSFEKVKKSQIINAIEVPKEYLITYELNNKDAIITSKTQKVLYNENYTLLTPTCEGYKFLGWKDSSGETFENGKWTLLKDVVLTAQWEESSEWTKFYD